MLLRRLSFAVTLLAAAWAGAQSKTYVALGDSVAWGYQPNSTSRGSGDKGYVKVFADYLGTIQGGVRPRLINLGIPGETTASFFDTSEIGGLLNSNYPILFRQSQANTFHAKVLSERSAGRTITHVTFALGANDLLDLQTTEFFALPFDQQTATVDATLAAAWTKLDAALTLIRQDCPTAVLKVPGYYNPYGAYPGSQEDLIGKYAIPRLNNMLIVLAKRYRGSFALVYPLFAGNELTLTWIGENDVHPRDPGYNVIAQALIGSQRWAGAPPIP